MIIIKKAKDLAAIVNNAIIAKKSIGFVPTMGALHSGHLSLIAQSAKENQLTICSIFINPTQFNNPDDFKKYPVTIETDIDLLEKCGSQVLFLPDTTEIYPQDFKSIHYELGYLETILEGKFRPGHFQGVCQVVDRLLSMVKPDKLYIGQKDFQQCLVISRLLELREFKIKLIICPTLRESDGLAMSSRNARLDPEQRKLAPKIYETLLMIKNTFSDSDPKELIKKATNHLNAAGFETEYIEIADAESLRSPELSNNNKRHVVLVAAYLKDIRLIDNLLLD